MIMFKAIRGGRIIKENVERITDNFVIINGIREKKSSFCYKYFKEEKDAREYAIKHLKDEVARTEQKLSELYFLLNKYKNEEDKNE